MIKGSIPGRDAAPVISEIRDRLCQVNCLYELSFALFSGSINRVPASAGVISRKDCCQVTVNTV